MNTFLQFAWLVLAFYLLLTGKSDLGLIALVMSEILSIKVSLERGLVVTKLPEDK